MAGLSQDIKEVLSEVGVSYNLLKPDGTIGTPGFIDFASHTEHTTITIREYFITGTVSFDSEAVVGDVLELVDGTKLLLTTKQPEYFENTVIDYLYASWVCNVVGEIKSHSDEFAYDSNYDPVTVGWQTVYTGVNAAQIPPVIARQHTEKIEDFFVIDVGNDILYLSSYYDILPGYKWVVGTSEYIIDSVTDTLVKGLHVCSVKKDTR